MCTHGGVLILTGQCSPNVRRFRRFWRFLDTVNSQRCSSSRAMTEMTVLGVLHSPTVDLGRHVVDADYRFKMAMAQSRLTTQARIQNRLLLPSLALWRSLMFSLWSVMFLSSSGCNSTPYIGSPKSGSVSGIPALSNTFQKVQSCILEITPSYKLLSDGA